MAKVSNYKMECGCVGTCTCGTQSITIQVLPGQGGARGPQGLQGATGTGVQGTQGIQGLIGPGGGAQGTQGLQGTAGGGATLQNIEDAIAAAALNSTNDLPEGTTNKYFTPGRVAYVHMQGVSSNSWQITHNLGFYPNVTVVDSAGTIYEGEIAYTNTNSLTVSFSASFSGKAYLS